MASSSYASTEETTNACRACRFLLGPCTDELRDVLRHHVPPSTFPHVIKQKRSNLPRLTAQQINLILPKGRRYAGNYDDMDISLLYILLRNICSIPPHSNGWGNDPDPTDQSLSANIERIRIARNQCVHSSSPVLSNADFNIIWSTVRSAVVDLDSFLNNRNKFEREVDFLRHETMDPFSDRHYIEELRKQAEEDTETREIVQGLKKYNEKKMTLIEACERGHINAVRELLMFGADANQQANDHTPLTAACKFGHTLVVTELIKAGADINLQGKRHNPLTAASAGGNMSVVQELIEAGADINLQGKWHNTLTVASAGGNMSVVQELLKARADVNLQTDRHTRHAPLTIAIKGGHMSVVKELIKAGADVNLQTDCHTPLTAAIEGGHISVVKELVKAGANVNQRANDQPPLTAACKGGHMSIVKELIEAGADVNLQTDRHSPLTAAIEGGHMNVVKELIEAGANVNPHDEIKIQQLETNAFIKDDVDLPTERFLAYLKKGKTTVRHARGIVVGCGGAGKTTLLYRLMGKSLEEIKEIKSTRGLHVYEHIFVVRNGDLSATEDDFLKKPLSRIPASELEQMEQNSNEDSANDKMERETGNNASMESIQADMNAGKEFNARENAALAPKKNEKDELQDETMEQELKENVESESLYSKENERNDQQLVKDVMEKILDAREKETSVSMFDFAGQFAYYACHQIYMRSEAFYVLVMDIRKAFNDVVSSETTDCEGSIFSTWTYRDYLNFWFDSIKSFSGPSAKVLAVATHAEGKTVKERDTFLERLWTLVAEEDKSRLYDRDFALGLKEMNEEGRLVIQSLKRTIAEIVSKKMDTRIEVPSAWALLEHLLQKSERPIMSISDINKENKKLQEEYQLKSQEEIFDFLSFFHGHGMLLFFKEEGMRTYAILSIQWFSNAFSKLIADKEHINRDCKRRYIADWNHFNATGNLPNSLVEALWQEESSYIEHKAALMSYMERLRMLVSIEGESSWYVPCMNQKPFTPEIFKQTLEKSSILCFRFTSFAMFVYYRLIAYCMSFLKWKVQLDKDKSQCLYHTAAIFETENHTAIVGIIDKDIQVQVLRINDLQRSVSCKIGKSIQTALTELTATFNEKKTFQKGYKCLNLFCSEKDQTFIPEDELSGSQCNCPIGREKHTIDVQWSLGFWKDCRQLETGKGKKVLKESKVSEVRERVSKKGCTYPFAKRGFPTDAMTSRIKVEVTRSVGLIYVDGNPAGTGFRVGQKYIMTCLHVIQKIITSPRDLINCQRIYIQFERMYHNQAVDQSKIFHFEPTLAYKHDAFDVAVLELRNHRVQFPPSLTLFTSTYSPSEEGVHLIGHPGCVQMKEDSGVIASLIEPDNDCDRYIKELSQWSMETFIDEVDYYCVLRDSPRKFLFHTTFDQGSSGSPGILIKNHEACVFLIVSGGVPSAYYEGRIDVEPEKRIEFGYALKDVFDEMQKNPHNQLLLSDIFRKWT